MKNSDTKSFAIDVSKIICGYEFIFLINNDKTVSVSGNNGNGQLGLGNTNDFLPIFESRIVNQLLYNPLKIESGSFHSLLLNDTGVYSFGKNDVIFLILKI
jgi:alpha-tubulin suppressor-like RCC1 family protein